MIFSSTQCSPRCRPPLLQPMHFTARQPAPPRAAVWREQRGHRSHRRKSCWPTGVGTPRLPYSWTRTAQASARKIRDCPAATRSEEVLSACVCIHVATTLCTSTPQDIRSINASGQRQSSKMVPAPRHRLLSFYELPLLLRRCPRTCNIPEHTLNQWFLHQDIAHKGCKARRAMDACLRWPSEPMRQVKLRSQEKV